VFFFLVCLVLGPGSLFGGFVWARWLRRKAVAPRFAAWAAYALLAFAVFHPVAACASSLFVLATYTGSLGTVSVDVPVTQLEQAAVATLLALIVLLVATARWHWFPRSPRPENDPPYR
jgi:hypothetical protein